MVHFFGYIIRIYHDARSSECQIGKYSIHLRGKNVFYHENRGNILTRNISNQIPNYALSHTHPFYSKDNIKNFPHKLVFSSRKAQGQIQENSRNNLLTTVVFKIKGNAL